MRAATPPTVGGSLVFVGVPTGTCSIFVPRGAAEAYDVSPWNGFTIEEYAPSFLLTDGEPFANDAVQEGVSRMTGENVTLPARIRLRVIDGNSTATGIDAPGLAPVASPSGIYTLDGRRVKAGTSLDGLPKGIYVVNGRKVVR